MLSLIEKVANRYIKFSIIIWNVAPVACDVTWYRSGLVFGTAPYYCYYTISWPWQIKFYLQKLLKYFNGKATSAFNLFPLFGELPIIFFVL